MPTTVDEIRSSTTIDAPIERVTMPDVPSPHSPLLLDSVVPSVARITDAIRQLASI